MIVGDLNLTHQKIDNCEPEDDEEYQRKSSRIWFNAMLHPSERGKDIPLTDANLNEMSPHNLQGGLFTDIFRKLHPTQENAFTNWCTLTGARQTNYGRRLDYILIDTELAKHATQCEIMAAFEGSDHCPVVVTLDCHIVSSSLSPTLCSKFMPEFKGQQKKLSSFFTSRVNKTSSQSQITKEDDGVNTIKIGNDKSVLVENYEDKIDLETEECSVVKVIEPKRNSVNVKRSATVDSGKSNKKVKLKKQKTGTNSTQISLNSFFSKKGNETKLFNPHSLHSQYNNVTCHPPELNETTQLYDTNNIKFSSSKSTTNKTGNNKVSSVSQSSALKLKLKHSLLPYQSQSESKFHENNIKDGKRFSSQTDQSELVLVLDNNNPTGTDVSCINHGDDIDIRSQSLYCSSSKSVDLLSTDSIPVPVSSLDSILVPVPSLDSIPVSVSSVDSIPVPSVSSTDSIPVPSVSQVSAWKGLLGGLPPPPLCPGHSEKCVLRTVKKAGPNRNKQFYVCARPDGATGNPLSRCNFFQWVGGNGKKKS